MFNVLIPTSTIPTGKRPIIYITDLRQAFARQENEHIWWLKSGDNVANAITNPGASPALYNYVRTGWIPKHIAQWVVRSGPASSTAHHHTTHANTTLRW